MLKYSLPALVIGFVLDLLIGDPRWLYHPICVIGNLIAVLEKVIRKIFPKNHGGELTGGFLIVVLVCLFSGGVPLLVLYYLYRYLPVAGFVLEVFWDDARIVSAHGRDCNLIALIRHNPKVFSILGTEDGVARLASRLVAYGMGDVTLYVGENLSYENEKIFHASAADLTEYRGDALSVVTACNEKALPLPAVHGICDEEFLRGKAPMTKEEVRTVSLSKLRLQEDSVCYDVGAGTGSVSVEMALRAWKGQVYAIEKKEDALALLKENRRKFATDNLEIVPGTAPEAMVELPVPTHAFIGGSSGNMNEIIRLLLDKNPGVRIVINCITLETVTEAMNAIRDFSLTDVDIVQLSAARSKSIGRYHMMMGENPIYIISCSGRGEEI